MNTYSDFLIDHEEEVLLCQCLQIEPHISQLLYYSEYYRHLQRWNAYLNVNS